MVSKDPAIHIDDSDVIKPESRKFEARGLVRMILKALILKQFMKLDSLKQDYVIRLKSNRKLFYHNKWVMATELSNRRKGKVRMPLYYKVKTHDAYLSHVKVQITASKKDIYLVLVYGLTKHPMMLATNKEIKSKEDVIAVAENYLMR